MAWKTLTSGIIAAAVVVGACAMLGRWRGQAAAAVDESCPTVVKLEKLNELVTAKVYVGDVLLITPETDQERSILGNGKGYILLRGDALIGIDLKNAKVTARDAQKKTITLMLPAPRVLQPRVDHAKTREQFEVTGIRSTADPGIAALRKSRYERAQEIVARTAGDADNISLAKAQAEAALDGVYSSVGWQLNVTWEK
ncbi:MAG: DUF4230 domain-containing protein [Phycisphaerae bacterium]